MPEEQNDEDLIADIRTKDQELYAIIVRRYEEKLLRYAQYLVQDFDVAKDIVQNAFIKAFINLQSFNTKRKFSSWIYRVVHNEAMNEIRKHRHEVLFRDAPDVEDIPSKELSSGENIDADTLRDMINASLRELPAIYREPLTLAFLEERSYQEISDILRLPVNTVGTRINRGKALLKRAYLQRTKHET